MITSVVVSVLFGAFTVAAAQLPPDIIADSYLLQAEQAIRDGDHARAQATINKIIDLQNEHELNLPDEFHFKYARVALSAGLNKAAIDSVNKYLAVAGGTASSTGKRWSCWTMLSRICRRMWLADIYCRRTDRFPKGIMRPLST